MFTIFQMHPEILHWILRLTRLVYLARTIVALDPRLPFLCRIVPAHLRFKAITRK